MINLAELEAAAKATLPTMAWDYYASGADDEQCLARNVSAYRDIELHYKVMVDVAQRELATTVLGAPISMPICVAPTAFQKLAHPDGELASVRAAAAAGTLFILSTLSTSRVEDVVAEAAGRIPVWFQLYIYKDRGATEALVRRVEAAGVKALVLTVDAPLFGRRERDVRNGFALPPGMSVANLLAEDSDPDPRGHIDAVAGESGLSAYIARWLDPSLTWDTIEWLRSITTLPVLVKGIVRADDAVRAVERGVAGIVVSNHGGRQLDAAPATIKVLPRIAEAVAGRCEILLDGGVRRGTDVIKAVAYGARAVLVGRPVLWGLAADGQAGVESALGILRREFDLAMALCGCPDVSSISRDLVEVR
ncbi:alpha-hydroxy acid oxidase [soil metagenome]